MLTTAPLLIENRLRGMPLRCHAAIAIIMLRQLALMIFRRFAFMLTRAMLLLERCYAISLQMIRYAIFILLLPPPLFSPFRRARYDSALFERDALLPICYYADGGARALRCCARCYAATLR